MPALLLALGRYDVEGWCTDRGALATWNLGRESINQSKPDVFIDTDVALMTCAFHPEHPVGLVQAAEVAALGRTCHRSSNEGNHHLLGHNFILMKVEYCIECEKW
eukprot:scaffold94380_cov19-Tisochrysis_lutea.AAC.1